MKVIRIKWVDSCSSHGWLSPDEVSPNPGFCESVGYLVRRDKEVVTIAQSRGLAGTTPFAEYLTIPVCCIQSVKAL